MEDAGIKLDSFAAEVLGVSARAMLAALIAGKDDHPSGDPAGPDRRDKGHARRGARVPGGSRFGMSGHLPNRRAN